MSKTRSMHITFWAGLLFAFAFAGVGTWSLMKVLNAHAFVDVANTPGNLNGGLFRAWAFAVPLGSLLAVIGALLCVRVNKAFIWTLGIGFPVIAVTTIMVYSTRYYPGGFYGVGGILILLSYFSLIWLWMKKYAGQDPRVRAVGSFKLMGYLFWITASWYLCGDTAKLHLKAFEGTSVPSPTESMVFLVLGWFFVALGDYRSMGPERKKQNSQEKIMIKMTKADREIVRAKSGPKYRVYTKPFAGLFFCIMLATFSIAKAQAQTVWPQVALSKDGTPVSYEVHGSGEPTLVFVHGWSCDARYWREQVPHFSNKYRVVTLDLAGHGHSGMTRKQYTMKAFGDDVRAVAEASGGSKFILIGHSMGGSVIAEAARLMPGRVTGLIGIDTFNNIEYPLTREEFEKMVAPLKADFREGTRQFAGSMILPGTDPQLREWILSDMSAAPPDVALSAMTDLMSQYIKGEAAKMFEEIPIPVVTVNADLWPINYEANRRHMSSYNAIVLEKTDHFLMMDRPVVFNKALEKAIFMLLER